MGGGTYSQDVANEARSSNTDAFSYQAYTVADDSGARRRGVHPKLNPYKTRREVNNETPIVVALDVTRSRGDDTKLMYEKLPMLMGQIALQGYVPVPGISFAAVGDAYSDQAPLQVGQFEGDNRLDEAVSRMWIEEGGGGTGQESYELAAYYYSRTYCVRLAKGIGKKGYFFFVGDEGFYPKVNKDQIQRIIGDECSEDVPASEAFRRLQEKFHVYLIYPKKTQEQRRSDIDAEIRQRVQAAGGQYDGVDVRASLIWNNRNDLDLHVTTPRNEHIYYGAKKALCGGFLDVDMNVRGETTKPVENVRWAKGTAPAGRYKITVQNYSFKESDRAPTPYKVELEINGEIRHFEGVISPKGQTGPESAQLVFEFDYDPAQRKEEKKEQKEGAPDPYAQYSDSVILDQWATVIPRDHILRIEDPKAIIDVLLGTLAIAGGARDLDGFLADVDQRTPTDAKGRIGQLRETLAVLGQPPTAATVEGEVPAGDPARARRSKRL